MNKLTLITALLFILISSPKTYELVRELVGLINKGWQDLISTSTGRPNPVGLILHGLVFAGLYHVITTKAGYTPPFLNAGQTGALSGTIASEGNETFMTDGKDVTIDSLSCYGGMPPSDGLPDLPPVTEKDIAHHP